MGVLLDQNRLASDTRLLDEFAAWLNTIGDPYPDDTVGIAAVFVDWRRVQSIGTLDAVDEDDIVAFLLDWCPHTMKLPADQSSVFCASVGAFLEFLGDTGRLAGGAERGAGLSHLAMSLASAMHNTMTNPESSPKSILTHPGFNPPGKPRYIELLAQPDPMSADELEAELRSRMADFKALPVSEQAAIIDEAFREEPEPVELPFVYVPPPPAEVEAVAAAAPPLLQKVEALREYLGEAGKPLTQLGNLKLVDGKALIDLLETGDEMEMEFEDRTFRKNTTERLPGLNSIVNIAKEAGAVRIHRRRLVPVKAWPRRSATERATGVYRAIIELGALGSRGQSYEIFDTVDQLLDGGIVHWLARILDPDAAGDVDELVELVEPVLRDEVEPYWPQWSDHIEDMARDRISRTFQTLEAAGIIEWTDRREIQLGSDPYPTGGSIRLTALGRHVVPLHLEEAGYILRRIDDLTDASVSALIDALEWVPDHHMRSVVDAWRPDTDVADRVQQIVDFLAVAGDSRSRLKAFAALEMFEPDVVGPAMRGLLDGPAAGHAAVYLLHRGLVDEAEVRGLIDIGVFVDMLSANLDDPEELGELFSEAPQSADQYAALEQMVHHPSPDTQLVLDALGQHLPDKKLAKAARKAAMRHRSWMANRR